MEKRYWMRRQRSAMAMARGAATGDARLIHYDLSGRYGVKAAGYLPFMIPTEGPAGEGERAVLHRPPPYAPPPPATDPGKRGPTLRSDPEGQGGEVR